MRLALQTDSCHGQQAASTLHAKRHVLEIQTINDYTNVLFVGTGRCGARGCAAGRLPGPGQRGGGAAACQAKRAQNKQLQGGDSERRPPVAKWFRLASPAPAMVGVQETKATVMLLI